MTSTTSEAGIEALMDHFLYGGFPRSIRPDGAKNLDSRAVDRFREENGIIKELSSAYFTESNGMAEAACKVVQDLLHKSKEEKTKLARLLSYYNNTPHQCGYTPAELYWAGEVRNPSLPRLPGCIDLETQSHKREAQQELNRSRREN